MFSGSTGLVVVASAAPWRAEKVGWEDSVGDTRLGVSGNDAGVACDCADAVDAAVDAPLFDIDAADAEVSEDVGVELGKGAVAEDEGTGNASGGGVELFPPALEKGHRLKFAFPLTNTYPVAAGTAPAATLTCNLVPFRTSEAEESYNSVVSRKRSATAPFPHQLTCRTFVRKAIGGLDIRLIK
jgi:hypothetical protein